MKKAFIFVFPSDTVCTTYPVQLNGIDPLLPVLGVLCSEVPHAVIDAYIQTTLIKLVRLEQRKCLINKGLVRLFCANDLHIFEGKSNNVSPAQHIQMVPVTVDTTILWL